MRVLYCAITVEYLTLPTAFAFGIVMHESSYIIVFLKDDINCTGSYTEGARNFAKEDVVLKMQNSRTVNFA